MIASLIRRLGIALHLLNRRNDFDLFSFSDWQNRYTHFHLTYVRTETPMAKAKSSRKARKETPGANELLVLELQEIHSAESQLSRVLPRLSQAVQSESLRTMLEARLEEGERIIKDIETVFDELDESPGRKKNVAAEGLVNDAREHVQEIEQGPALDAVLIGAVQKTEHYCIAAWGTARALAQAVGQKTAGRAMDRALKESGPFDEKLTKLAETEITPALLSGEDAAEGDDESDSSGNAAGAQGRRNGRSEQRASK
jgi:ferritin-like metal-binding protein YciE